VLQANGFTLRPYRADDAKPLARAANNRNVWRNLGHVFPHPYTLDDAHAWIASCLATLESQELRLAIDIGGVASGGISLSPRPLASPYTYETGYWLGEEHWGRGIVTKAVALIVDYAFQKIGAERVQATPYSWNPASKRVLEKNGFEFEGLLRRAVFIDHQWGDLLMFARLR
jgi:RimJ/RimL family protein N-acetyltransferase